MTAFPCVHLSFVFLFWFSVLKVFESVLYAEQCVLVALIAKGQMDMKTHPSISM